MLTYRHTNARAHLHAFTCANNRTTRGNCSWFHSRIPFSQLRCCTICSRIFLNNLIELLEKHSMNGVDYNWEYPRNEKEWKGLSLLLKETSAEFVKRGWVVTMAYYPDGHQVLSKTHLRHFVEEPDTAARFQSLIRAKCCRKV